jgi:hypothetical protein
LWSGLEARGHDEFLAYALARATALSVPASNMRLQKVQTLTPNSGGLRRTDD